MREYTQTVTFTRLFTIDAKNAAEANDKLRDLIDDTEFQADVRNEGWTDFEDDPVECPKCKGNCVIGEDEQECDRCKGEGVIDFEG